MKKVTLLVLALMAVMAGTASAVQEVNIGYDGVACPEGQRKKQVLFQVIGAGAVVMDYGQNSSASLYRGRACVPEGGSLTAEESEVLTQRIQTAMQAEYVYIHSIVEPPPEKQQPQTQGGTSWY